MLTETHKNQRMASATTSIMLKEMNSSNVLPLEMRLECLHKSRNKTTIDSMEAQFVTQTKEIQASIFGKKVTAAVSWDYKGFLLMEFLDCETTVNSEVLF